jgi:hypothetical protein
MLGAVNGSATTLVFAPPALGLPLGALLVSTVDHRIPLVISAGLTLGVVAHALRGAPRVRAGVPGEVA